MPRFLTLLLLTLAACPAPKESGEEDTANPTDKDGDGWTVGQGDCMDSMASVNPGVTEVACDGVDNNCDGFQLNDGDGDGFDCRQWGGDDCDDANADIRPRADDVCGDGIDADCDGWNECDCDGDNFEAESCYGDDCDDNDPERYPGAREWCYDGIDQDCGGESENDCDGDGFDSIDYGGTDCADEDARVYPGATEECRDFVDNDCDATTPDCDCDADGYDATECGGTDCNDDDPDLNPGVSDANVDGIDNDCDGDVDEGAYCNIYAPMANGSAAKRNYDLTYGGARYTEVDTIMEYDPATTVAVVRRLFTDAFGMSTSYIDERWTCDDDGVYIDQYDYDYMGTSTGVVEYTRPRYFLLSEADMVPGATWTYSYTARSPGTGDLWAAEGTYTVVGTDTLDIKLGTFTALVITNEYELTDLSSTPGSSYGGSGTSTLYYVAYLGVVYSIDIGPDGKTQEEREMTGYDGFEP